MCVGTSSPIARGTGDGSLLAGRYVSHDTQNSLTSRLLPWELRHSSLYTTKISDSNYAEKATSAGKIELKKGERRAMWGRLKQFDAYPKTLEDFRVKTYVGASSK